MGAGAWLRLKGKRWWAGVPGGRDAAVAGVAVCAEEKGFGAHLGCVKALGRELLVAQHELQRCGEALR